MERVYAPCCNNLQTFLVHKLLVLPGSQGWRGRLSLSTKTDQTWHARFVLKKSLTDASNINDEPEYYGC